MLPDFIKFSNNLLLATDRETRLNKFSKDKNFPFKLILVGEGIDNILEAIINNLPPPKGKKDEKLKCLLVDSWYDSYLGVVILVRVIDGKIKKNMKIKLLSNNKE